MLLFERVLSAHSHKQRTLVAQRSHVLNMFLNIAHNNLLYCNRSDHQDFSDFINSASNTEKAKETCNAALRILNVKHYSDIKESGYLGLERTSKSTVEET